MSLILRVGTKLCVWSLTYVILAWNAEVLALPDDASKPLNISADAVEIDDGKHTSTYIGKVEMQQGSMHLWGDHVVVYHQASRQPERIIVNGKPARYEQTEQGGDVVQAEGQRMDYNVLKNEVWLTNQASFKRGKDSFSSDRIFYDRKTGVVKGGASAQGQQRVHISIFPNSGTVKPKPTKTDTKPPADAEIIEPVAATPTIVPAPPRSNATRTTADRTTKLATEDQVSPTTVPKKAATGTAAHSPVDSANDTTPSKKPVPSGVSKRRRRARSTSQ